MSTAAHQQKSHSDMRLRENREELVGEGHEHLTKDGNLDHRYKENREDGQENSNDSHGKGQQQQSNKSQSQGQKNSDESNEDESAKLADIPTKNDGTADMRYKESQEAVSSGLISKDEVIEEGMDDEDDQKQDRRHKGSRNDEE